MKPQHTLTECLTRYAEILRDKMLAYEDSPEGQRDPKFHDTVQSYWDEIRTVEYWAKVAVVPPSLFDSFIAQVKAFDAEKESTTKAGC